MLPLLLTLVFNPPAEPGSRCRISATDDRPVRCSEAWSRMTTGELWDNGSWRIRDPVTMMASASSLVAVATGAVDWALALLAISAASATLLASMFRNCIARTPTR